MAKREHDNPTDSSVRELIEAAAREAIALGIESEAATLPTDAVPGFEIIDELGRGGMGVVYRAMQLSTERTVALKVMLAGCFASPIARKRFYREIVLSARLQHPGIVRVLESGQTATGQPYYAMDYVEGVPLDCWRITAAPDQRAILRVFAGICDALEHAHQQGVIHRDLKPANVLIDERGVPHVLDFGLAKAVDVAAEASMGAGVSVTGQVVGTLRYLSPEQAGPSLGGIDARADVYGVGLLLYETLTGAFPYDPLGSPHEVIQRIREEPPAHPSRFTDHVNRELEIVILKAIEKDKSRRYQSAAELAEDLRRYVEGEPILARAPSSFYVLRKRLVKQRLRVAVAALALSMVCASIWCGIWWRETAFQHEEAVALAQARHSLLMQQRQVEAPGQLSEDLLASSVSLANQHPSLIEAQLAVAHVRFRLGRQHSNDQMVNSAIVSLRLGLQDIATSWAYGALLSDMLRELGRPPSNDVKTDFEQNVPRNAESWYVLSFACLRISDAVERAEKARLLDPESALVRERLAYLYQLTDQADQALPEAEKLIELGYDAAQWRRFQAEILLRAHRYEEAMRRYTQAIAIAPDRDEAYRDRALVWLCMKKYQESVDDYTRSVVPGSTHIPWERYYRATPLWALRRFDEAAADYRVVSEMEGHVSFADARLFLVLCNYARVMRAEGDVDKADALSETATRSLGAARRSPASPWLHAILDCLAGNLAPAELVAMADEASRSQRCEACYYAGEACLLRDQRAEAARWFEMCVDTTLVLDPAARALAPMNEYHLARWRLDRLKEDTTKLVRPSPP